jgi:hypothetical protein
MSRRFTIVTLSLAAIVAFLVGVIWPEASLSDGRSRETNRPARRSSDDHHTSGLVNFADVVGRSIRRW